MSGMNYRTLNLALPTGGNLPTSAQPSKRQDAVPSSPSSSSSPARQRNIPPNGGRSAYLIKPLYAQNQSVVSNALVLTGHQPPTASSVSHAVVIYGQNGNSPKLSAGSPGDHFRPRTGTGQGSTSSGPITNSPGRPPSLAPSLRQSAPSLGGIPGLAAGIIATGNSAPGASTASVTQAQPAQGSFADDELMILKEQILKLQRALESLGSAPTTGSGGGTNNASSSSSSSSSIGSMSSSSLVSLGGITVSTTSSNSSSNSSAGSNSNRTSRSGEGIPVAPWVVSTGGLEAMLQQACALLTTATAPGASAQAMFASAHDAAMTAARAKLLDLFVRKAHQLLLESAPELWLMPLAPSGSIGGTTVAAVVPEAAAASRGKPPLAPGGLPEVAAAQSHNARIQSAPVTRSRSSNSSIPVLPPPPAQVPEAVASVVSQAAQAIASQPPPTDLSPAGVLVAASRRLSELQAVAVGAPSRSKATEQQLANTQAKLDSALADNTLLRNMISELQSNIARPSSRGNQRPESPSLQPPRPSTPSPAPPPDPALLRHISTLTSDLGLVRGRLETTQKRLEASETAAAELRKQLQEAQTASHKPATSAQACQTQNSAGPEGASAAAEAATELRLRVAQLEAEAAEARKAQQALRDKLSEAEADVRKLHTAAAAADDLRHKLEAERRLVSELHSQLGRSSTEAAEAAARLSEARARVLDLEGQLRQQTAAAAANAGTIRDLQSKLEAAAAREVATRRELDEFAAARRRAESEMELLRRRLGEAEAALATARREAAAAVEKSDRKRAELAARISTLDQEQKRLAEELRVTKAELEAARELAARKERDANVMRDEKFEACARLTSAHHELDAERRRLAEELAAAQKLRSQLLDDANAVKALGTLVQAKTLRLDFGGGSTASAAGVGVPSGGAGGVRPGTGDPAATVRLTNLVKEQQEKLQELADKLASREDRCARLQVALTQAEAEAATAGKTTAERAARLADTQASLEAAQEEVSKLKLQLDELSRHGESVKAHNAELHKMAEKLQREGAAASGEVRELRAQLDAANQQLSDERAHRQRLLGEVVALSEQRDSAASGAATLKAQRRSEYSRLEELQAALLLATQKLAGAERTITAQDERIALLLARVRAAEERLGALGVSPPASPGASGGAGPLLLPDPTEGSGGGDAAIAAAAAAAVLQQRAGSTVPLSSSTSFGGSGGSGAGGSAAGAGGGGGGLQPPIGSLSLAPEAVTAQQRLSQLMTGGAPALGSMVQDMINKVLGEASAGSGGGGGSSANAAVRSARASARSGTTGRNTNGSTGGGQTTSTAASTSSQASSQQQHMLLRPSSASVVGRVLEHAPPGLSRQLGIHAQPHPQAALPQHGAGSWGSGFGPGPGGSVGGSGNALRPQSAWTQRGGSGGLVMSASGSGNGGVISTSPAMMRRTATSVSQNINGASGGGGGSNGGGGGLQMLSETDAFIAGAAAAAAVGGMGSGSHSSGTGSSMATSTPPRSVSPAKMLGTGPPSGSGSGRVSSGGSGSGAIINSGGAAARNGGGRPATAVSKKTVLLLSMSSPAAQLDEVLAVGDDWQPV